jgi:hypothetical protein
MPSATAINIKDESNIRKNEARGSRTSATSETLGTADKTATTESASIIKDNSQHASSSGNAGVSREVRKEGRKHYDMQVVMQATAGTLGTA